MTANSTPLYTLSWLTHSDIKRKKITNIVAVVKQFNPRVWVLTVTVVLVFCTLYYLFEIYRQTPSPNSYFLVGCKSARYLNRLNKHTFLKMIDSYKRRLLFCLLNGAIVRLRVRSHSHSLSKDRIDEAANAAAANHTTAAWEMSATSRRHLVVMVTDASWINARAVVLFI